MVNASALFEAIDGGDLVKLEAIVAQQPELARARDPGGVSALLHGHYRGRGEAVALLRPLAEPLDLFEAAALGDETRLAALLSEAPTSVSARSADGFTPLHLAAFFGHPGCVRRLLEAGAALDPVATNAIAVTPLQSAVAGGHHEAAALLIRAGADVHARQQSGWTALHSAAQHGDGATVDLLLAHGADPDVRNDTGITPAGLARDAGHAALAGRLTVRAGR